MLILIGYGMRNRNRSMIFYNSLLAKCFLRNKRHYFMIFGFFFTRKKYLEIWEDMELRIHNRQYWECSSLTIIPALGLSLWLSWWWMVLPFITYHLLYWLEKAFRSRSVFNWEALTYCGDAVYMRKRKSFAWMKWYGKKQFPKSEWDD